MSHLALCFFSRCLGSFYLSYTDLSGREDLLSSLGHQLKLAGVGNAENGGRVAFARLMDGNALADEDGALRWSFRVASRVAAGEYPVTVSGGGEVVTVTLVVVE